MKKKNILLALLFIFISSICPSVLAMEETRIWIPRETKDPIIQKEKVHLKKKLRLAQLNDHLTEHIRGLSLFSTMVAIGLPISLTTLSPIPLVVTVIGFWPTIPWNNYRIQQNGHRNKKLKKYLKRKFEADPHRKNQVTNTLFGLTSKYQLDLVPHIIRYTDRIENTIQHSPYLLKNQPQKARTLEHLSTAKRHYKKVDSDFVSRNMATYVGDQEINILNCIESLIQAWKASEPPPETTMELCTKHIEQEIPRDIVNEIKQWMDTLQEGD